jgi:hypothetical protein
LAVDAYESVYSISDLFHESWEIRHT